MERNVSEVPDNWVILKLPDNLYKVYATWAGGYLDGDAWKMNSGIVKVEQDDDNYYFFGYSGSCYKCNKKTYGVIGSLGHNTLDRILKLGEGKAELMEDSEDWTEIIK